MKKEQRLSLYCKEFYDIENYELAKADNFKGWVVHHRFETKCPVYKPTSEELKKAGIYYNRPASELIFMKNHDHEMLHNPKGRKGFPQTNKEAIRKWHIENKGRFYKCLETGEIMCEKDWKINGFHHVRDVSNGKRNHCHNKHFEEVIR